MNMGEKIIALRKEHHITQKSLAEILNVSQQAVHRWEVNQAIPDIDKLVKLSNHFGTHIDDLLNNYPIDRISKNQRHSILENEYESMKHDTWYDARNASNLKIEYQQCYDEGKDVERYKSLVDGIYELPTCEEKEEICEAFGSLLYNTRNRANYVYYEPSELWQIREQRIKADIKFKEFPDDKLLYNKLHGAWLGRICGSLLGETLTWLGPEDMKYLLKETNNYPLCRYVLSSDLTDEIIKNLNINVANRFFADTIAHMHWIGPMTRAACMSMVLVENFGKNFQPVDVARHWHASQPKNFFVSADRIAYINFIKGYLPPDTAIHRNPFREWNNAMGRSDYFGYICPGEPETAAKLAWCDSSISHYKNGMYGSMFIAAMLAAAVVCDDAESVISCGLSEIPHKSRLYFHIRNIINIWNSGKSFEECLKYIKKYFSENGLYNHCHIIPNILVVVMALLYGKLDYGKSVCRAVETAFSANANGAIVGSVVGMIIGAENIPEEWTKVINNSINTSLYATTKITNLVSITLKHIGLSK